MELKTSYPFIKMRSNCVIWHRRYICWFVNAYFSVKYVNMWNVTLHVIYCRLLSEYVEIVKKIVSCAWYMLNSSSPLVYSSIKLNLGECTFCTSASSQNTKQKQWINESSITAHFWIRKDNRAYSLTLKMHFPLILMVLVI